MTERLFLLALLLVFVPGFWKGIVGSIPFLIVAAVMVALIAAVVAAMMVWGPIALFAIMLGFNAIMWPLLCVVSIVKELRTRNKLRLSAEESRAKYERLVAHGKELGL